MKILLYTGFSGWTHRTNVIAELLKNDYEGSMIDCLVYGKSNYKFLVNQRKVEYNKIVSVDYIYESIENSQNPYTNQEIFEIESIIGHSLTHLAYSERGIVQHTHNRKMLRQPNSNELCTIVINLYKELCQLVSGKDFVFVYTPANIISELLFYISKSLSVPVCTVYQTRIGWKWLTSSSNVDQHPDVLKIYDSLNKPSKDGEKLYLEYRANLKSTKQTTYQKTVLSRKRLNFSNISRFIYNVLCFSSEDLHFLAPNRKQRIIENFMWMIRKNFCSKYFCKSLPSEQFVYFPLSTTPEASTLIRGQRYYDQLSTIKSLSLEVPLHWKIVVKEHPGMIGKNPLSFYKELKRIYNVHLIDPFYEGEECIMKSEAVITVTGTTGMEALALGKKTIVLGSTIYSELKSSFKIRSISEIGPILRAPWKDDSVRDQENDMMKFATAILESNYYFEDPDEILWTKKAFGDDVNAVDENIYKTLKANYLNSSAS